MQILQIDTTLQGDVANEMVAVQSEIAKLSQELIGAEEKLRRIGITAPRPASCMNLPSTRRVGDRGRRAADDDCALE